MCSSDLRVVEERVLPRGRDVQLGNSLLLGIPIPEGYPYLARVTWASPSEVLVIDGRDQVYVLAPDRDVEIEAGPVTLRLSLVKQFYMRRVGTVSVAASAVWFAIVLMSTLSASASDVLYEKHCSW